MELEENDVQNSTVGILTYTPWYEHVKECAINHWKTFVIYNVGVFGIFWGLIEAGSFFFKNHNLNNITVFTIVLCISFISAVIRVIIDYRRSVPAGLENESSLVQNIARSKQPFWEYALAYELLKSRIDKIDKDLDNIMNKRVNIKVTKSMDIRSYVKWLDTRPTNLLRILETAKQLLIFDLLHAIQAKENEKIDFYKLIEVINLIGDLYKNAYDFEVEGHEIKIPDGFELIHEIQFEWVPVIRDGFHQMKAILLSVAERDKEDYSPVEGTITFEAPPRIDEFCEEFERLVDNVEY